MSPKEIRTRLGFSVEELSQLLGVSASTAYRWEKQELENSRIDPLQRKILGLIEELLPKDEPVSLAAQIRRGLLMRGTLGGLCVVLVRGDQHP